MVSDPTEGIEQQLLLRPNASKWIGHIAASVVPKPQEPEPKQASPQPEGKQAGTGA